MDFVDIYMRNDDLNFRNFPKLIHERACARKVVEEISRQTGERALVMPQILSIAYMLGLGDRLTEHFMMFNQNKCLYGVPLRRCHLINKVLASNGKINCKDFGINSKWEFAYTYSTVRQAFQKLEDKTDLSYSSQRFEQALELLALK